jgi:hypothetical protein
LKAKIIDDKLKLNDEIENKQNFYKIIKKKIEIKRIRTIAEIPETKKVKL